MLCSRHDEWRDDERPTKDRGFDIGIADTNVAHEASLEVNRKMLVPPYQALVRDLLSLEAFAVMGIYVILV
jgi:hypothetical protein